MVKFAKLLETHGISLELIGVLSNALKYRRTRIRIPVGGDVDLLVPVEDDGYCQGNQ